MTDAEDVFHCITPALTTFMFWEPPRSLAAYKARREARLRSDDKNDYSFVIRRLDTMECLGIASLDDVRASSPELGIWIKEAAHGYGYGSEAVRAVAGWASQALGKESFMYSVAIQNVPSRRLAEALGGEVIGTRTSSKYDSVVYKIHWKP
jgi:RimJ/RimL family protein N-acetyltransferase